MQKEEMEDGILLMDRADICVDHTLVVSVASVLRPAANQNLSLIFSVFTIFSAAGLRATSRNFVANSLILVRMHTFLIDYNYKIIILNSLHICDSTTLCYIKQATFVA